jgi:hypothetical protein
MNQLTDFLSTLHYAPCACVLEFAEFYGRFVEWLPADDRWRWSKRETARLLRKTQELFYGNDNKLFLADVSFRSFCAGEADESRMNKYRGSAQFVDDGARGYYAVPVGDEWRRITLPALNHRFRVAGLTCEEIYRLRKEWRANPVRPLLAGCA